MILVTPTSVIEGTISYLIIHGIIAVLKKVWSTGVHKTERALAIRHHYHARAKKQSHFADSVLLCSDGKCQLF